MLTFEHVRKNYDSKRVLEDCSISFEPGKVYALVGPNGTGKSTLMKAAAGLVKINGGTLTYKGQPIGTESKKHIAYMSTEPFYYDYMRIRDVKAFAEYANGAVIKETVIAYKKHLQECYAVRSINSMLASINSLFAFLARFESEIIKVATAGLLPRRKRTYKGGIHTPLPCGAK